ncbi:hypothetical protein [Peribacillus cavernae]|uniref:hypothetical protein n=1 Tax=Peribacillus cavernae TaxID=1674310 RepID=UPI00163BCCDB|nr:hypothetical protein [Peribacillus cavernae]MDQ0221290.1 ABC-type methionine transport system ATPase subunit [Peribacillus cavernae]
MIDNNLIIILTRGQGLDLDPDRGHTILIIITHIITRTIIGLGHILTTHGMDMVEDIAAGMMEDKVDMGMDTSPNLSCFPN